MTQRPPLRIAILAYEGCLGTEVFGVLDVLHMANRIARAFGHAGPLPFDVHVVSVAGRRVRLAGGVPIGAERAAGSYNMLIVPGAEIDRDVDWDATLAPLTRELAYIQRAFAGGCQLASICIGAFLLGEAGVLAGRRATTSWMFASALGQRYPATTVEAQAVLLEDGAVTTTGAISATFDLAIRIVGQALGARLASATARIALLPSPRASQAPYVDAALVERSTPQFAHSVRQWLETRLAEPYDLQRLALAFHVSARTLLRRVKTQTGQSPLTLLQQARINKAKQLLAGTAHSLARITEDVGYTDVATFSRLFASHVGETPAQYRRR